MDNRKEALAAIREAHRHPLDGGPWRPFPLEPTPEREEHALQLGRALVGAVEEARRADKATRARAKAITEATREKRRADKAARARTKAITDAARERRRADEAATEASALKAQREKARAGRAAGTAHATAARRSDAEQKRKLIETRIRLGQSNKEIAADLHASRNTVAMIRKAMT